MLVNKIAESGLITLRPEEWVPNALTAEFDLKDFLFKGLILKEQEFRQSMKEHDWSQYADKILCVFCSVDAIIPNWAYMLVASHAFGKAREVFQGSRNEWEEKQMLNYIESIDISSYKDQRVIIKGCSEGIEIGPRVYTSLTNRLLPVVKSLMFGEPCSTVPVFKRPKEAL